MEKTYNPRIVEDRIYAMWEEGGYFRADVDRDREPFCIVIPPPNVTGQLHMGHALDETYQDILRGGAGCRDIVVFRYGSRGLHPGPRRRPYSGDRG